MSDKAIVISWDTVKGIGQTFIGDDCDIKLITEEGLPADCIVLFIDKAEWPSIKKQAGIE